jgi:hypothetical protein
MIFKTGIEWKLLSVKGKLDFMNMVDATQNIPHKSKSHKNFAFLSQFKIGDTELHL